MHCERPFVFNDELRYFAHKRVSSLPCDICEETNYLIKERIKPVLLVLSIVLGAIACLPLAGSLWFIFDLYMSAERIRIFILIAIPIAGFLITSTLLNVIYRNYIWQTHRLSKRFESPFLDNLNR